MCNITKPRVSSDLEVENRQRNLFKTLKMILMRLITTGRYVTYINQRYHKSLLDACVAKLQNQLNFEITRSTI
jgi:hypothetical protein